MTQLSFYDQLKERDVGISRTLFVTIKSSQKCRLRRATLRVKLSDFLISLKQGIDSVCFLFTLTCSDTGKKFLLKKEKGKKKKILGRETRTRESTRLVTTAIRRDKD